MLVDSILKGGKLMWYQIFTYSWITALAAFAFIVIILIGCDSDSNIARIIFDILLIILILAIFCGITLGIVKLANTKTETTEVTATVTHVQSIGLRYTSENYVDFICDDGTANRIELQTSDFAKIKEGDRIVLYVTRKTWSSWECTKYSLKK